LVCDEAHGRTGPRRGRDRSLRELSGSTRRRIGVAVAVVLLSSVPIVVLDESTASLDAAARRRAQELIAQQKSTSHTFVLCAHIHNEAEAISDCAATMVRSFRDGLENGCPH
jgi:energy-coupling factor transport system ATP-binding protein